MRLEINGGELEQVVDVKDLISSHYGNLDGFSYCGDRTYTLKGQEDWVTFDGLTLLTVTSNDETDEEQVDFPRLVVRLTDYNIKGNVRFKTELYCPEGSTCGNEAKFGDNKNPATLGPTSGQCDED